jgi:hypothetical protein
MSNFNYSLNCSSDKIDYDNKFIIIDRNNLHKYYKRYNCNQENDLEDYFWINYGVLIKII